MVYMHGIGMSGGKLTARKGGAATATRIGKKYNGGFTAIGKTLQVNPEPLKDFCVSHPFLNRAKLFRDPEIFASTGFNAISGGEYEDIVAGGYIDANGYVNDKDPAWSSDHVVYQSEWSGLDWIVGDYVFTYDGADACTVQANLASNITITSNTVGRVEFTINEPTLIRLRFPTITSANHPRNFVICRTDQQSLLDSGEIFDPRFLSDLEQVSCVRFMDWMETNTTHFDVWADYPTADTARWWVCPFEIMVALCNTLGCDGWWCVPGPSAWATADGSVDTAFAEAMATYLKANLADDLVAKVEYSNETWNPAFAIHNSLNTQAVAAGWSNTSRHGYCGKINALMAKATVEVYGDEADARFRWVFGAGNAQSFWVTELLSASVWEDEEPGSWFDPKAYGKWIAPAHYYGSSYLTATSTVTDTYTLTIGTDGTDYGLFDGNGSISPASVNRVDFATLRTNGADTLQVEFDGGGQMPFNFQGWNDGSPATGFTLRFPGLTGTPSVSFTQTTQLSPYTMEGTSAGIRALLAAESSVSVEIVSYKRADNFNEMIDYVRTSPTQSEFNVWAKGKIDAGGYVATCLSGISAHRTIADNNNMKMDAYEGGSHVLHSFATGVPDAVLNEAVPYLGEFQFSEETAEIYAGLWDGLDDLLDAPFQQFQSHTAVTKFGAFGMRESLDDVNDLQTYIEGRSNSETPWWEDNRRPEPDPA